MKVGILGTGDVGRTLGRGFVQLGHDVKLGARSAENPKMRGWVVETGPKAAGGTFADAALFGDLLVVATLGTAVEAAIAQANPANFAGKVVIDTTNPLDFTKGFPISLTMGQSDSAGELVQRLLPNARVVKAFNTVGASSMVRPTFPDGAPDMFICGNDDDAKNQVTRVCQDFGWGVVDLGPIQMSRCLEPMALAWVIHGLRSGAWTHAFKLLRR